MDEVMDTSENDPLETRHFQLHSMIREAACLAKCLCTFRGCNIGIEVDRSLPNHVVGDERRVFQVILHMVGNLLKGTEGGYRTFRVLPETMRSNSSNDNTTITVEESLSFAVCRKLVQLMQGEIRLVTNPKGFDKSMAVVLGFQIIPSSAIGKPEYRESPNQSHPRSLHHGVKVLLADSDDVNRAVTRKMLEKLGCIVAVVSSGYDCLGALGTMTMRIQKFRSRSWPLIIGLAATADENISARCLQIGMNGIIRKPVLLPGLAHELHKVLLQASR
ncbi:hypothetical protein RND71_020508 [Anisodus tanguticus]|uniref:Response regulatory domain-containing protein n=1 Tax=Anisodus tanguticus TaxID=243964 RepID=A0AAE1VFF8_9SOLA|nr:hypothetical protein RND71_020508 [Anisodus tanguticus]